jgi:hypothetical protein
MRLTQPTNDGGSGLNTGNSAGSGSIVIGQPSDGTPPVPPVDYTYLRPGGVDTYHRPDGTSIYIRP